jgi:hypothetical protein
MYALHALSVVVFSLLLLLKINPYIYIDKVKVWSKPIRVTQSKHAVVQMPKEGQPVRIISTILQLVKFSTYNNLIKLLSV